MDKVVYFYLSCSLILEETTRPCIEEKIEKGRIPGIFIKKLPATTVYKIKYDSDFLFKY